jgi:hypothetical protein
MKLLKPVLGIWAVWALILFLFQSLAADRVRMNTVDRVLNWTTAETGITRPKDRYYLNGPVLNRHINMDSEFYLSIACGGYDDRSVRKVGDPRDPQHQVSLNYAFFPLYPVLVRIVSWPFWLAGLDRLAVATIVAVIISFLSALVAAAALFELFRDGLGQGGAKTAVLFFLIFPSAFFLGQVYTEALFCALAFSSLAFIRRRKLLWGAIAAALAVLTRGVGIVLAPLFLLTIAEDLLVKKQKLSPREIVDRVAAFLIPLTAYIAWRFFFGENFDIIHENYFSRGFLVVARSLERWQRAFGSLFGDNPQTRVYYLLEIASILAAAGFSLAALKKYPLPALFGLGLIAVSAFSGVAQSQIRYMLPVPALYLIPALISKRFPLFEKGWLLGSTLLFGLLTILYSADMWVG